MKRINVNRDVESRKNIAAQRPKPAKNSSKKAEEAPAPVEERAQEVETKTESQDEAEPKKRTTKRVSKEV